MAGVWWNWADSGCSRARFWARFQPRRGARELAAKNTVAHTPSEYLTQFIEDAFDGAEADAEAIANELQMLEFTMSEYGNASEDAPPYVLHLWADHLTVLVARVRLLARSQAAPAPQAVA